MAKSKTWRLFYLNGGVFGCIGNNPRGNLETYSGISVQSDSQLVANFVNAKIGVPKCIVNLVEDVQCLLTYFTDSKGDVVIGLK